MKLTWFVTAMLAASPMAINIAAPDSNSASFSQIDSEQLQGGAAGANQNNAVAQAKESMKELKQLVETD